MHALTLLLPRSAFTPREAARAGDVWRAFQDLAVFASIEVGWPPSRYRREGNSFVVREMSVVHARETHYGEPLRGRTCISRVRREMFFQRECELTGEDESLVARATQQWVHVSADLVPTRAPISLTGAFAVDGALSPVDLPSFEAIEGGREHVFELECWHTWMDPLAHVNHPAYVDFCDEATSRALADGGVDPVLLSPVAETIQFRSGLVAGERARVSTRVVGRAGDIAVLDQRIEAAGRQCARALAHRRLFDGSSLVDRLR